METDSEAIVAEPWEGWRLTKFKSSSGSAGVSGRTAKSRKLRLLELEALEVLKSSHPGLFQGVENTVLSAVDSEQVFSRATDSLSGHSFRYVHNFLVRGLVNGQKRLNWTCSIPGYLHVAQPSKSFVSQGLGKQRDLCRQIREAFFDSLMMEFKRPQDAMLFEAGQLIVSLALNARLMHQRWLEAFPKALKEGIFDHGGYRWFELEINLPEDEQLTRRLFPDSLTLSLVQRWYVRYGRVWPPVELKSLLENFFGLSSIKTLKKTKFRQLLDAAVSDAAFDLPPFLVHYASSFHVSSSLSHDNWMRLLTGRLSNGQEGQVQEDECQHDQICLSVDSLDEIEINDKKDLQVLAEIKSILGEANADRKISQKEFRSRLKELLDRTETDRFSTLFIYWLLDNIKRWKPSTMLRYLGAIGVPLVNSLGLCPFDDLEDPEAWSTFYEEVVSVQSPSKLECALRRSLLADFHRYLIRVYGAPPVGIEHMYIHAGVQAAFISPREYARAIEIIKKQTQDRALRLSRLLILVLGYRCGMRRGEAKGLLSGDLHGIDDPLISRPEILIRANRYRSLKSNMGMRRLPIWALLTDQEIEWLREWKQSRDGHFYGSQHKNLLFDLQPDRLSAESNEHLFKPITRALTMATGNEASRFHDLRHSFANITLLRMLEMETGDLWPKYFSVDDQGQSQIPHAGRRLSEVLNLAELGKGSSKVLWVLSGFCGHVDTKTTFASYVHLLDLVLFRGAESCSPTLTIEQQAALLDVRKKSLEVRRSRKGIKGKTTANQLFEHLSRPWPKGTRQCLEVGAKFESITDMAQIDEVLPIKPMVMYGALGSMQRRMEQGHSIDEAADFATYGLINVSSADIQGWSALGKEWIDIWRHHSSSGKKTTIWESSRGRHQVFGLNYGPILNAFLPTPRSPREHHRAASFFHRMVKIQGEGESDLFDMARTALVGAFKYQPEAFFETLVEKKQFWQLLTLLGLKSQVTVVAKVAVTDTEDSKRKRDVWSQELGIPSERFRLLDPATLDRTLDIERQPQIHLNDPDKRWESPWPALRFALLAFLVQNEIGPGPVVYRKIKREKKQRQRPEKVMAVETD